LQRKESFGSLQRAREREGLGNLGHRAGQSTGILLVLGLLKPRKSFAERHILLDRAPGLPI
jgi:hypothetical protein